MKAIATKIEVERCEGPIAECSRIPTTVRTFREANDVLRRWALSAPAMGGYDKCAFVVDYGNGDTYSGRFDLKREHLSGSFLLEDQMRSMVRFMSGEHCPPHMTVERYRNYLATVGDAAKEYAEFGAKCQIGDTPGDFEP